MVLGMNTIAFADDVAEVAATEETAEVAASSNGKIDHYGDYDGMAYNADNWVLTTVEYASNGAKKNAQDNVVTITNVSDPISWNNLRGTDLIETVLYGDKAEDTYLNNKEKLTVSNANYKSDSQWNVPGLKDADDVDRYYDVVKVADGAYLFVGYDLSDGGKLLVAGHDDVISDPIDDYVNTIPVRQWDGRKIAFNKSGDNNATKSNIDALNVKVALVKYENGTLTELNGASVANVKIDKKAIKKASVAYGSTKVLKTGKYLNKTTNKKEDWKNYLDEYAALGDIPSFTLNVKLDKSVKKTYAKDVKTALKDKKYFFGIQQRGIKVTDPTNGKKYKNEYFGENQSKHWNAKWEKENDTWKNVVTVIPASANDAETIQKAIAGQYGSSEEALDTVEKDKFKVGDLTVSKFTEKKANVVLTVSTRKKGKAGKNATITLKAKKDYELKEGTLAGEKVVYIDFPDGGNYVYANTAPNDYDDDDDERDLSVFGYKWAFRKSPDKKSKMFRRGIYAANDLGFVFSK